MSLESSFMRALANVQPTLYREVIYKVHAVIWGLLLLSDPGSLHSLLSLCRHHSAPGSSAGVPVSVPDPLTCSGGKTFIRAKYMKIRC